MKEPPKARESNVQPINAIKGGGGSAAPIRTVKALSEDLEVKLPSKTKRQEDGSFSFEMKEGTSYRSPQKSFEREFFGKQGFTQNPTMKHVESSSENKGWDFGADRTRGDVFTSSYEFTTKSGRTYRMTRVTTSDWKSGKVKYTFKER